MVVGGGASLLGFCVCVGLLLLGLLDCCGFFIWTAFGVDVLFGM